LKKLEKNIPIVFITAQRDDAVRARVLEQGAIACLFKPFSDTALSDSVSAALERGAKNDDGDTPGTTPEVKMRTILSSLVLVVSLFRPSMFLWRSFRWDL
jgi:FixJ family two-component response regulator